MEDADSHQIQHRTHRKHQAEDQTLRTVSPTHQKRGGSGQHIGRQGNSPNPLESETAKHLKQGNHTTNSNRNREKEGPRKKQDRNEDRQSNDCRENSLFHNTVHLRLSEERNSEGVLFLIVGFPIQTAIASLSGIEGRDGGINILLREIRPKHISEIQLGISGLPHQKVG